MPDYKELARTARIEVLGLIHRAGTSHIASNFSVIDMATVLYENLKPEDRVVWSKGWVAATIYYFLYKQGKISYESLRTFPNEPYLGLAEPSVEGVEVSGGAMGHGLPVSVGIALAKKRAGESGNVYCIMSDGELNEGTTWESAALAAHHKLDNLVVLIDVNKWQAMGKTEDVLDYDNFEHSISDKWEAFGWLSVRCNGHDYDALDWNLKRRELCHECAGAGKLNEQTAQMSGWEQHQGKDGVCGRCNGKGIWEYGDNEMPYVIICDTVKGKGVSFMENHLLYHYKNVSKEDYEAALKELA